MPFHRLPFKLRSPLSLLVFPLVRIPCAERAPTITLEPRDVHRHTHVSEALHPPLAPQVLSELASVNIRLFPFAAALAKRGHTVLVSDPDHLHQVPIATLGPENKHIKAPNHHEHTSTQSKPAAALLADASDLRADTHA